jgi:CDP-glucose 4,6-dehydratase
MTSRLPDTKFWKNKKVLVTGHSGFKGSWLVIWLNKLGALVTGISLEPSANPNLFTSAEIHNLCDSKFINICNFQKLKAEIQIIEPEIVIHMAAQPLVRKSYSDPLETFETNIMGTANLLETIRYCDSVKTAVMITTDKVYKNNEDGKSYSEEDSLGGHDPYSSSKAGSEIVIESYKKSFLNSRKVSVSSARAGNVIGGGDWSEDRLIPDVIKSWKDNISLEVRNPQSIRPWQHVLEPLSGYLFLAEDTFNNSKLCSAYNFGPYQKDTASVKDVIECMQDSMPINNIEYADTSKGPHEANLLYLDIKKSESLLSFTPKWGIQETVHKTACWYKNFYDGVSALSLCQDDILDYEQAVQPNTSQPDALNRET